jgi:hypothetical protein
MFKKLSEEYHQLCRDEMEAEARALRATMAIRTRWHIDGGTVRSVPSSDALDAEADLRQRVAELHKKRRAWVAQHSKKSTPLRTERNTGNAPKTFMHVAN